MYEGPQSLYLSPSSPRKALPLAPKTMKNEGFQPRKYDEHMGEITSKNEGYRFPMVLSPYFLVVVALGTIRFPWKNLGTSGSLPAIGCHCSHIQQYLDSRLLVMDGPTENQPSNCKYPYKIPRWWFYFFQVALLLGGIIQFHIFSNKLKPPTRLTCPLKRDHLKRTFHLPTIYFQEVCLFFCGVQY